VIEATAETRTSQTLASVAAPLAGCLLITYGAVSLICKPPRGASLSWVQLLALELVYIAAAVCIQAALLFLIRKAFPDHVEVSAATLLSGSWLSAAWMPLLALLAREDSIWMATVPPLIVASTTVFLRRWRSSRGDQADISHGLIATSSLFHFDESPSFLRMVLPAVAAAIAFEAGFGLLIIGHELWAGLLFAGCTVFLIWKFPLKQQWSELRQEQLPSMRKVVRNLLPVMLCTAIALLPFLRSGGSGMFAFLRANRALSASPAPTLPSIRRSSGGFYSGVILYLPPKPQKEITAPAPVSAEHQNGLRTKPIIIPFDGVYWFFEPPHDRPESDARVVREDPLRANVRSTDRLPLLMEAHQILANSVKMDCCRAFRVQLLNGDHRLGTTRLEVKLRETRQKKPSALSLGEVVLSSGGAALKGGNGHASEETLNFPIPARVQMKQFDEITLIFKPSEEREFVGARVSIEQFVLIP
jgi:hypothetical protein